MRNLVKKYGLAGLLITGIIAQAPMALAGKIVANCTGMVNFDIYTIDTELAEQDVEIVGKAMVDIDEKAITLTGPFGEMVFDRKLGTLYQNGSDTGVYYTYSEKG